MLKRLAKILFSATTALSIALHFTFFEGAYVAKAAEAAPEQVIAGWPAKSSHPLVGKILRTRDGNVFDGVAASREKRGGLILSALDLKSHHFILLGEIHDNPEHHLLRAGLIDDLTERSRFGRNAHPPVVTEHIRADQAPQLAQFRELMENVEQPPTAADLFKLLPWEKSGWPAASMFRPLYDAIALARLRLVPGDASRVHVRLVSREGIAALDAGEIQRLGLDVPLPGRLTAHLRSELVAGHCGMIPEAATAAMADAQRYRDAVMADALMTERPVLGSVILLAGNGHIRTDRGVPWHLRRRAPDSPSVTVMLVEVEEGKNDPASYLPQNPDGGPAADFVILTPGVKRDDPCEKMRGHMQKAK